MLILVNYKNAMCFSAARSLQGRRFREGNILLGVPRTSRAAERLLRRCCQSVCQSHAQAIVTKQKQC